MRSSIVDTNFMPGGRGIFEARQRSGAKIRYRGMSKSLFVMSLIGMIVIAVVTTAGACNSGILGTVTLGPTCPVERPGMTCSKPYAGTIDIYSQSDRLIKTVRSNADGKFRVNLKPGTYTLKPQPRDPARPYPMAKPVTVTVKPGSYASANIQYDTGIR